MDRTLHDVDYQNWNEEVERNRLCLNYRILTPEIGLEKYLLDLKVGDRCGNHNLPAVKCRYSSDLPLEICSLCSHEVQVDEFHYVLVCPFSLTSV